MIVVKNYGEKIFPGWGDPRVTSLSRTAEGITVIAGSYRESEREKTSEIIVRDIDLNGNEKRNRTFSIGKSIEIQDIAVIPGEGYFVTGKLTENGSLQKNGLAIIKILDNPPRTGVPVKNSFDLTVITKDAKTGIFIGGAHVYLDGRSFGSTLGTGWKADSP